jgi:hypothetical protein
MLICLYYALWLLAPAFQAYIAYLMWRRGMRDTYPIFFNYTVFESASTIALICLRPWYHLYFYGYWVTSVIGFGLAFAVIFEVFQRVFRPYDTLRDFGNVLFRWAAVVLVLVAIVTAAGGTNGADMRVMQTILVLDRSVRVMQCGLVLFLFLFSGYLGLSSRAHIFGIALGFGIFASFDLGIVTMRAAFGPMNNTVLSLLKSAIYSGACGLWLFYLRSPEPERRKVEHRLRMPEWNYALADVVHPPAETFMPMIESAVDRILAQRSAENASK